MRKYTVPRAGGLFPRKQFFHFNPLLSGEIAYVNGLVEAYWDEMRFRWRPRNEYLLLTPCSNVKPYPASPSNTKIRMMLKRLGLWHHDIPAGIDWVFISDLLGPVPYERTWIEPACCYDVPPQILERNPGFAKKIRDVVRTWWIRVKEYYRIVYLYLPKKYMEHVAFILDSNDNPKIIHVKYHIFHGSRRLEETIKKTIKKTI